MLLTQACCYENLIVGPCMPSPQTHTSAHIYKTCLNAQVACFIHAHSIMCLPPHTDIHHAQII